VCWVVRLLSQVFKAMRVSLVAEDTISYLSFISGA
jgi:hypothetical protein